MKKEDPNNSTAQSESSLKDSEEEEPEELEEDLQLSQMSDHHVKRKLKPSGVCFQTNIDPDASSDDEKTASRMEASAMAKQLDAATSDSKMAKLSKSSLDVLKS